VAARSRNGFTRKGPAEPRSLRDLYAFAGGRSTYAQRVEDHCGEITEMVPLITHHLSLLTVCDFPLHRRLPIHIILQA
jgi:hypothetical protein